MKNEWTLIITPAGVDILMFWNGNGPNLLFIGEKRVVVEQFYLQLCWEKTLLQIFFGREREREKCMCACDCLLRKRDISTFFKARSRSCRSRGAEICAATTISITHAHAHTLHNTNENLGSCSSHTTLHLLLLCTTRAYVGNNNKYLLTSIDNECVCMRQRMCGYLQNQLTFGLCSIVEGTMCKL